MKKTISILLCISILLGMFSGLNLSVYAEDSDDLSDSQEYIDIDVYKAQCFAGIALDENSDAVAHCHNIYNYYVYEDPYSPTKSFLDACYDDPDLMADYYEFMAYSTFADPGSFLSMPKEKIDYYKSIIISVLYKSLKNNESNLSKFIKNKAIKNTNSILSNICKDVKIGSIAELAETYNFQTSKDIEKWTKTFETYVPEYYSAKVAGKALGITGQIISYSKDVVDFTERISTYASMAELDQQAEMWLNSMYDFCDSNTDPTLKEAIKSLRNYGTCFADACLEVVKESSFQLVSWGANIGIDIGISALTGSNPVLLAATAGLKGGKLLSNIFFDGDSVASQFFTMQCIYKVEELARLVVDGCEHNYKNNQTTENAQTFTYAVDNYFEILINTEFDCMKKFLDTLYNGGVLKGLIKWIYGATDDYQSCVDALDGLREVRKNNYDLMNRYYLLALQVNFPETYDYYFAEPPKVIPIEGIRFDLLCMLPPGYPSDYADLIVGGFLSPSVSFYPENTTQRGYVITSDNADIIRIEEQNIMVPVAEGTVNVTVTSIENPNISYSTEIKVGNRIEENESQSVSESTSAKFTYTANESNKTATITGLANGYSPTRLSIPSVIDGYRVISIGDDAFYGHSKISSIVIPNPVSSIGSYAFSGCSKLSSVVIPNSVNSIGGCAFQYCEKLTAVTIPNSITVIKSGVFSNCINLVTVIFPDSITSISSWAFESCRSIKSIVIPNSVTSIGHDAFEGCTGLTSIIIPDSVISIGDDAFAGTPWYNNQPNGLVYAGKVAYKYKGGSPVSVIIKDGTLGIADNAFEYCDLTNIIIPGSVISIGNYAFSMCFGLKNITIPNSVTNIGQYAFNGCSIEEISLPFIDNTRLRDYFGKASAYMVPKSLKNVTITGGKTIGEYAFEDCTGLESVTIENSVTSIGFLAFGNCTRLTCISIPDSITSINRYAFDGCDNLQYSTYNNATYLGNNNNPYVVLVEALSKDIVSCEINSNTKVINDTAFSNCNMLKSVTIPNSVITIEPSAFFGCTELSSVTIGNSVTSINNSAFSGCTGLTSITIPDSVISIGDFAFGNCIGLTSVYIGNSATSIDLRAFSGCKNIENAVVGTQAALDTLPIGNALKSIVLGDQITKIGRSEFSHCTGLTSIIIPNSVTAIYDYAFENCTGLTSIIIPNSVISIGFHAFDGCKNIENAVIGTQAALDAISFGDALKSIKLGDRVEKISDSKFNSCFGLTSIAIPDSVTLIGNNAFYSCTSLTSITIPDSVTTIGYNAFLNCISLTSITIPDSVTSICNNAFYACTGLTSAIIGSSVTAIGNYAFCNCSGLTSVTIGNSVTSIGHDAFGGCYNINAVYISDLTAWCNINFSFGGSPLNYGAQYNDAKLYINATLPTEVIIKNGVTKIPDYTFCNNTALTDVIIPDSITSIGSSAFSGCSNLSGVTIGKGVTSIGSDAFLYCNSIENAVIGSQAGLDAISFGCKLKSIVLGDQITEIPSQKFYNCTELTSISLPENLVYIGQYAFQGCRNIKSITIPEHVIYIGHDAFASTNIEIVFYNATKCYMSVYDEGLDPESDNPVNWGISNDFTIFPNCEEIIFADNVTFIPTSLIANNKNITSLTLPQNLQRIQPCAFMNCINLNEISIPDNVSSVGFNAFDNTGWLNKQSDGILYVGKVAYDFIGYSSSIKILSVRPGTKEISSNVFRNCYSLLSVYLPDSINRIGYASFENCYSLNHIVYSGSEDQWHSILIDDYNDSLFNAIVHCNSLEETISREIVDSATCVKDGTVHYSCELCDFQTDDVLKAVGHHYEVIDSVLSTCTEWGYTLYHCAICGEDYQDDWIQPTGHFFVDGFCENCGLEEGVPESEHPYPNSCDESWIINKPNADRIAITFSSDTQTEQGCDYIYIYDFDDNQIGYYSGDELSGKKVIVHGDTIKIRLTSDGSVQGYGFSITNIDVFYEPCEHLNSTTTIVEPSCTMDGYTRFYCSDCEYENRYDYISATGHNPEVIETILPTCTEYGYTRYQCLICGEEYSSDWVEPIWHDGELIETILPTCTEYGYSIYRCSTCNEDYESDWVEPVGHIGEIIQQISPTCIEEGYILYHCTVCDEDYYSDYVEPIGHHFENDVCVHCNKPKSECIESLHNYENNCDQTWTITKPGADRILVTFSSSTEIESGWDYIYIYGGNDNEIGCYTGRQLSSATIEVQGDTVKIRLVTDEIVTRYGFAISNILAYYQYSSSSVNVDVPYGSNISDALLIVDEITITEVEEYLPVNYNADEAVAFDIHFKQDGNLIQPTEVVTVSILVPDSMDGNRCKVFHINDGQLEDMQAIYSNGYMVFNTNHFSCFILVQEKESLIGDVNGDGEITSKDVTILRRYLAGGWDVEINEANSDINGDGEVTSKDVTLLRRYLAGGWGVELG